MIVEASNARIKPFARRSRMIALCSVRDSDVINEHLSHIASQELGVRCCSINEGGSIVPGVTWCVILLEPSVSANTADRVACIRRKHPLIPTLVIAPSPFATSVLHAAGADGAVCPEDIATNVCREIVRVRAVGIRRLVCFAATQGGELRPLARRAIVAAAKAERPFRTVGELATALGTSRSTLWHAWSGGPERKGKLKDFLDWLRLTQAVAEKHSARTWFDVALQLGTHEQSLARVAIRVSGQTLHALVVCPYRLMSGPAIHRRVAWLFDHRLFDEYFSADVAPELRSDPTYLAPRPTLPTGHFPYSAEWQS